MALLTLATLLATATGVAKGQEQPRDIDRKTDRPAVQDTGKLFQRLDADEDGVVTADEAGQEHRRLFRRLLRNADKNKDGQLDHEEFNAGLRQRRPDNAPQGQPRPGDAAGRRPPADRPNREAIFKRLDANGDGKIVLDEVPEQRRENFARAFRRLDKNEDKALSLAEFRAGGGPTDRPSVGGDRLFGVIDTDGDGTLSPQELKSAAAALKKLDRDGDGSVSRREAGGPRSRDNNQARGAAAALMGRFDERDRDGDGKWSRDEAPRRLAENFARVDANDDGFIDKPELKRVIDRLSENRPRPGGGAGNKDRPRKTNKEE